MSRRGITAGMDIGGKVPNKMGCIVWESDIDKKHLLDWLVPHHDAVFLESYMSLIDPKSSYLEAVSFRLMMLLSW